MKQQRYIIFTSVVGLALGLMIAQLVLLQIIGQENAREAAQGNAFRMQRVLPARGGIYDRHGVLMVYNEPTYTITVTPRYFNDDRTALLASLLETEDSIVTAELESARQWNSYRPSALFQDVSFAQFSRVQENIFRLPGVNHEISQKRQYRTRARAAHALGYLGEITRDELEAPERRAGELQYRQGDLVGKTGVERRYEPNLRGTPGIAYRIVNVHGLEYMQFNEGLDDEPPRDVFDVHLAMDAEVQALAESLFVNKRGGVAAIDPTDGGLIALVSKPDYDPEIFSRTLEDSTWNDLILDESKPLYNRATMNLMPPGSTWKPFVALLALSEELIDSTGAKSTVFCPGYHPIGRGRIFRCLGTHGHMNLVEALTHSCNTFFFEMAARMNVNRFKEYAHMFGFGELAPTDIQEQTPGLIPDSAYYNATYDYWSVAHVMNLGIGQGDMGVTPLQLARYTAAIANGGVLHAPYLVNHLVNTATDESFPPDDRPESTRIPIRPEFFELVRHGMRQVMEMGSGRLAQIPDIPSGGKTGTAQAPGQLPDHSLFVMFAPYDHPRIAIAVQCENAGSGSGCAAPIASLLAELYLKRELPDSYLMRLRMERALTSSSASESG